MWALDGSILFSSSFFSPSSFGWVRRSGGEGAVHIFGYLGIRFWGRGGSVCASIGYGVQHRSTDGKIGDFKAKHFFLGNL